MKTVVIDPPKQECGYLYQEECCYNTCPQWQVPARALHIATDLGADYVQPPDNWDEFGAVVNRYDEAYMLFTPPLLRWLNVPMELRPRITAVANPPTMKGLIDTWGFKRVLATSDFGLDVAPRFWSMFDGATATIQANSGCVFRCNYCTWNRSVFTPIRWADPVLVGELSSRASRSWVLCSQLTGQAEWIRRFINARSLPFNDFATDLNAAHMPHFEGDIRSLAEVGMNRAIVGTEAFFEQSLKRLHCPHTVAQARQLMLLLAEVRVEGIYEIRRGYGETLEEIAETRDTVLSILGEIDKDAPLRINVGPIYYWHDSDLMRSIETRWVSPLGYNVRVERMDRERLDAWQACYDAIKAAGWQVR